jgi:hypothetical protein
VNADIQNARHAASPAVQAARTADGIGNAAPAVATAKKTTDIGRNLRKSLTLKSHFLTLTSSSRHTNTCDITSSANSFAYCRPTQSPQKPSMTPTHAEICNEKYCDEELRRGHFLIEIVFKVTDLKASFATYLVLLSLERLTLVSTSFILSQPMDDGGIAKRINLLCKKTIR